VSTAAKDLSGLNELRNK